MEIIKLKDDVMDLQEANIETLLMTEEEAVMSGYNLSFKIPASTIPIPAGWRIIVLKELTPVEQLEMVAHELGHLLLKGKGLYEIKLEEGWSEYLTGEINNVIFHHFIIRFLQKDYNIGSSYHLELRQDILNNAEELIGEVWDEPAILHGIGLHLLDLSLTLREEDKINKLLDICSEVKKAYTVGKEFLVYPDLELSDVEQYNRIKEFLVQLGYKNCFLQLKR